MNDKWFFIRVDGEDVFGDASLFVIADKVEKEIDLVVGGLAECVRIVNDTTGEILFALHTSGERFCRRDVKEIEHLWS